MDYLEIIKKVERERKVHGTLQLVPGARIHWQGSDGKVRGPAIVQEVTVTEDGRRWVWVEYEGIGRWVSEVIIQKVEVGLG